MVGLREGRVVDLAVVLQADALSHLATRVVAPVIQVDEEFTLIDQRSRLKFTVLRIWSPFT